MLEWVLNKLMKRADELETRRRQLDSEAAPSSPIDDWMRNGYILQQSGQFDEAEALYRKILFKQPGHADALFMLSEIKQQQGQYDQAIELCKKAVGANGEVGAFYATLAGLYNRAGALEEAEAAYREAVRLEPENPEYLNNLGSVLLDQKRFEDASGFYRRALELRPDFPQALYNIGVVHQRCGERGPAIEYIEKALGFQPGYTQGRVFLGDIYLSDGKPAKAVECYERARKDGHPGIPNLYSAYMACGNECMDGHRPAKAAEYFRQAVQLDDGNFEAWVNLGNAHLEMGRIEEAMECQLKALERNPACAKVFGNLCVILRDMGDCGRARACLDRVNKIVPGLSWTARADDPYCEFSIALALVDHGISLDREEPDFHLNKGTILEELGNYSESLDCFERAIHLDHETVQAHFNMGIGLLRCGEMERGWAEYEWRLKMGEFAQKAHLKAAPLWHGEALEGKTLLIHAEQGLGDSIQFIRYYRQVRELCQNTILECQPAVKRLFQGMPGVGSVYAAGETLPDYDCQVPLLSLPRIFGTRTDNIPGETPYMFPDRDEAAKWAEQLSPVGGRKVGLVWAGSKEHKGNRFRSCSLAALAPLADVPGVSFFSLQKGDASAEAKAPPAGMRFFDHTERLSDFVDTAALMANLDLVITVDTSVAHLAGAMGKPVWVLTPFCPDWRWLLEREDSPWYPSMRLFRQTRIGDWAGCIARVKDELARLAGAPGL